MYKGYRVQEVILHDYEYPETVVVVDVSCGCHQCNELGSVQSGHGICGVIPSNLLEDENVFARLDSSRGWFVEFIGDNKFVDEWLTL